MTFTLDNLMNSNWFPTNENFDHFERSLLKQNEQHRLEVLSKHYQEWWPIKNLENILKFSF